MESNPQKYELTTDEFAALNLVKASTVRARLCKTGSYFSVRPLVLASGRTAWPRVQVEKRAEVSV
jgi:hypothetical protein